MTELQSTSAELGQLAQREHRNRPSWLIVMCFVMMAVVVMMSVIGPLIAPHDPYEVDLSSALQTPSGDHILGTDALGRDVLSRVIDGARYAMSGPLVIAVGAAAIGTLLGLTAGHRGGRVDAFIMRWVDFMWAVPSMLVLVVVAGTFGGYWLAVALLVVLTSPFDARMVRAATLEQMPRPYVEAAKVLGLSNSRIMFRHVWPNVASIVVTNVFLGFAAALVALSGLSFLGLGVEPGTADWGLMVSEGRSLLFTNAVAVLAPAGLIVATATSMNLIGDWLYEHLSNKGVSG